MLCALIMAGGKGTRFWPLSTEENPKQFLNLVGNESMIQMTVNRLKPIIPMERIFVVTDQKYESLVSQHLRELPEENIIIEPVIFFITTSSLNKIIPNTIINTVDNCFIMLNADGSRPYLASIFSLSVNA